VVVDKLRLQRIIYENTSRDLNIAQGLNLGIQKVYFASSQALYSFLLVLDLLIYPPTWLLAAPTYSQICSQSQAQNQHNDYFRLRSSWTALIFSAHFYISSNLSICLLPKSFSCMLLSPINHRYRKSVVPIGGVCKSASWPPEHTNVIIREEIVC